MLKRISKDVWFDDQRRRGDDVPGSVNWRGLLALVVNALIWFAIVVGLLATMKACHADAAGWQWDEVTTTCSGSVLADPPTYQLRTAMIWISGMAVNPDDGGEYPAYSITAWTVVTQTAETSTFMDANAPFLPGEVVLLDVEAIDVAGNSSETCHG